MTTKEMKAAVDKLKMLQNGKAALEGMRSIPFLLTAIFII